MNERIKKWGALIVPFLEDGTKIMLLLFLSLAVLIFLIHALMALSHRYPLDYGEAPLIDQAMRLAAGQNIYRPDLSSPPYTISNYPPLYALSLAPFVKLFGPSFLAGRAISLLCTLASGAFLALIVYIHSQDHLAAVVTGLLLLLPEQARTDPYYHRGLGPPRCCLTLIGRHIKKAAGNTLRREPHHDARHHEDW